MLAIYGCRQVGAGHEHLKNLSYFLNMPEPVLSNNDQNILLNLKESAKRVAEKGMSMAASKLLWVLKKYSSIQQVNIVCIASHFIVIVIQKLFQP